MTTTTSEGTNFYERVNHLSLGKPDIRQKRLSTYLTIENYIAQNNLDFDEHGYLDHDHDDLGPPIRYYEIVNTHICNRIIKEIYYFSLDEDSEADADTIKLQFDMYVQLLKDVIKVIHQHIYKDIFEHQSKQVIDSILHVHEGDKLDRIVFEWLSLQLKIMDYLFHFIETHLELGHFIHNTATTDDRIEVHTPRYNCTNFISRTDAKDFLKDLDFMERSFFEKHTNHPSSQQIQHKKTFDSIHAVRKNIQQLFNDINPYVDSDGDLDMMDLDLIDLLD